MTTIAELHKVDGEQVDQVITEARTKLDSAQGEIALNFSGVRRIDPKGLEALEELAAAADAKSVKLVLRGVNVDVYKVLKLAKVAGSFTIEN